MVWLHLKMQSDNCCLPSCCFINKSGRILGYGRFSYVKLLSVVVIILDHPGCTLR